MPGGNYIARATGISALEDPELIFLQADDFLESPSQWLGFTSGVGAAKSDSTYGVNNTENAFGVEYVDTGTTAAGVACLHKGYVLLGRQKVQLKFRAALENLGDILQDYTVWIGLFDQISAGGEPVNGVYFKYKYDLSVGRWQCKTRDNSVETLTASAAAADTLYHLFEIVISESGLQAEFFIDGVLVQTIITNIPRTGTRVVYPAVKIQKTAGTTSRKFHVDYHMLKVTRSSPR